jgi:ABC-2 type transport system permease protein
MNRILKLILRQMGVQLRIRTFNLFTMMVFFLQPAIFVGIGLLLSRAAGNDQPNLIYTVIGGGMMGLWGGLVFTSTYDIRSDRRDGTLEYIVGSPTSLSSVVSIRTFANILGGLVSLFSAFLVTILVFNYSFAHINIIGTVVSFLLVLFGLWSIGIFLANFLVWSRLSGMVVQFLEIPIPILCGFMFPITVLPKWVQSVSGFLPIRWSIAAFYSSLQGVSEISSLFLPWSRAVLLSLLFWGMARWLTEKVHNQIRITGEMRSM